MTTDTEARIRALAAWCDYGPDAMAELIECLLDPTQSDDALGWVADMQARCGMPDSIAAALSTLINDRAWSAGQCNHDPYDHDGAP